MEGLRNKIFYSAFGVSGGLAGLVNISGCSGNACASCFGCAGAGIGILLVAAIKKFGGKNKSDAPV
ncbi:MAG: hypothetical protein M1147_04305 [Nitrospirae bacterium]|nr:hypothetical protein [Nitrospirota bacterium]MCL5977338.1 hypothetical protein [Nitrospirota bacterium]